MHPRLVDIDLFGRQLSLSSYGLAVATGVMLGIYLGYRRAKREGLDTDAFLDLCFWGLIVALLGSRLMYVLTNLERFEGRPFEVFAIWEGGLVFYGGMAATAVAGLYFFMRRGLPFLHSADIIVISSVIGHAFGRLGCFMSGCCWGKACGGSPPGVRFGPESLVYENLLTSGALGAHPPNHTPLLHPVQLYESAGDLVIFALLLVLSRAKRFHGMIFCSYLMAYALLRGFTELYRGDAERRFLFEAATPKLSALLGLPTQQSLFLSTSQFVAMLTFGAALAGMVWLHRRAQRDPVYFMPLAEVDPPANDQPADNATAEEPTGEA